MTAPADKNGFVKKLEKQLAWRKKEIIELAATLSDSDEETGAGRRAALCLHYAHWEGFVRDGISLILTHVRTVVADEDSLALPLRAAILLEYIKRNNDNLGLNECMTFLKRNWFDDFTLLELPSVGKLSGNVSFETFSSLVGALNFDMKDRIELKRMFINSELLDRRNKIAHGVGIKIDLAEFRQSKENILELLDLAQDIFVEGVLGEKFSVA